MDSETIWELKHCFKIHKRNLNNIKLKPNHRNETSAPESLNYIQVRRTGLANHRKQLSTEIYQENKSIFARINQISNRPTKLSKFLLDPKYKPTQFPFKTSKKLAQIPENPIPKFKSQLSSKLFAHDYEKTLKLKKLLKKRTFIQFTTSSHNKLPQIRSPK